MAITPIETLDLTTWRPDVAPDTTEALARALESGAVVACPRLAFVVQESERRFLDTRWSDGRAKHISLDGDTIKGAAGAAEELAALRSMVARFASDASALVAALFPRYAPYLKRARSSYRPM